MLDSFQRLQEAMADRYTLERELGAGGMATVYLAHDPRHNRKVAIKVMNSELAAIIGAARFLKEIETTANLQHPNILPLFDSGQVEGTVFYVMPYVQGESLRNRLTREIQLPDVDAGRAVDRLALAGIRDDMRVGEHVTVVRDDEAGALRALAVAEERIDRDDAARAPGV